MSPFWRIFILILAIIGGKTYKNISDLLRDIEPPQLPLDQWWGDGDPPADWQEYMTLMDVIVPNRIGFPPSTIADLQAQLNRTLRLGLTPPLEGVGSEYGYNVQHLPELLEYWRDDYLPRWREREIFLWQFNHFTTEVQGLQLHFFNVMVGENQRVGKKHYPVLLLHGWPGSIREFYPLIRKLGFPEESHKEYIFNVIVPSLPGYAWSQATSKPGLGPAQIAVLMRNLMVKLGYKQFFVQGGDWGSLIGSHIATLFPDQVLGYHSNLCANLSPKSMLKGLIAHALPSVFAPSSYQALQMPLSKRISYFFQETGYHHLQATKPDTIGVALGNNPVGLAVYILEKFSSWTNPAYRQLPDGGLWQSFDRDALLDNVMIYYLTNSIITSQRIYAEAHSREQAALQLDRVPTPVPTGCAHFQHDLAHFQQYEFQLRHKYPNLIHNTYHDKGGHFAALEVPEVLHEDFIEFVRAVEEFNRKR